MNIYSVQLASGQKKVIETDGGPQMAGLKALELLGYGKNYDLEVCKEGYNLMVKLENGARHTTNTYKIVQTKAVVQQNFETVSQGGKQTVIEQFKEIAKKEKARYVAYYEKNLTTQDALEAYGAKHNCKKLIKDSLKEGNSIAETAKKAAKAVFEKNSTSFDEMIVSAQPLGENFIDVDISNRQSIEDALSKYPCVVLAKKSSGGITGYLCTTNLGLHSQIFGSNFYVQHALTEVYNDFINITQRKIDDIKNNRVYNPPQSTQPQIKVASLSMRLKEKEAYDRTKKIYLPTGKMEISSHSYSLVFDNVLCIKAYTQALPIQTTMNNTINNDLAGLDEEDFRKKYTFDPLAYRLALKSLRGEVANVSEAVDKRGKEAGFTQADIDLYIQTKAPKVQREMDFIANQASKGKTC